VSGKAFLSGIEAGTFFLYKVNIYCKKAILFCTKQLSIAKSNDSDE